MEDGEELANANDVVKNGIHNLQGDKVAIAKAEVEAEDDGMQCYMGDDEEDIDEEMYSMEKFLEIEVSSKPIAPMNK